MRQSKSDLASTAIAQAMRIRREAKIELHSPISIFDVCEKFGVSVRFHDIPSMEGMYMPEGQPKPVVIVSSLRPPGRRALTCGHEFGHHIFKHGKKWDELKEVNESATNFEPHEFQSDVFSAYLQMPKLAVSHALACRNLDPQRCKTEDLFALSGFFGVSYSAFVTHLELVLKLIDAGRAKELSTQKPKNIRDMLLGYPCPHNLYVVDLCWNGRAVDIEVGDILILPSDIELEGASVRISEAKASKTVVSAIVPGISRVQHVSGWCAYIRVMRKNYVGCASFRFDEETYDDT